MGADPNTSRQSAAPVAGVPRALGPGVSVQIPKRGKTASPKSDNVLAIGLLVKIQKIADRAATGGGCMPEFMSWQGLRDDSGLLTVLDAESELLQLASEIHIDDSDGR
ncbi:hypothetical protein CA85_18730 [Allorhodopirellula solitaria]|uniref:Uncharacterized protein n=1 Tax=Allorhodopirellula solitaria TaxID=2527987 RepID=A0A5C5YF24_9BACT|nr:hypothetical protein CA85_18730 [Allorhodopirellula solitaria]